MHHLDYSLKHNDGTSGNDLNFSLHDLEKYGKTQRVIEQKQYLYSLSNPTDNTDEYS